MYLIKFMMIKYINCDESEISKQLDKGKYEIRKVEVSIFYSNQVETSFMKSLITND